MTRVHAREAVVAHPHPEEPVEQVAAPDASLERARDEREDRWVRLLRVEDHPGEHADRRAERHEAAIEEIAGAQASRGARRAAVERDAKERAAEEAPQAHLARDVLRAKEAALAPRQREGPPPRLGIAVREEPLGGALRGRPTVGQALIAHELVRERAHALLVERIARVEAPGALLEARPRSLDPARLEPADDRVDERLLEARRREAGRRRSGARRRHGGV